MCSSQRSQSSELSRSLLHRNTLQITESIVPTWSRYVILEPSSNEALFWTPQLFQDCSVPREGFTRPLINWRRVGMSLPAWKTEVNQGILTIKNLTPVWRAVLFQNYFCQLYHFIVFFVKFPSFICIICCFFLISLLLIFGIHRDTVV